LLGCAKFRTAKHRRNFKTLKLRQKISILRGQGRVAKDCSSACMGVQAK
jgi:hypothetical protein